MTDRLETFLFSLRGPDLLSKAQINRLVEQAEDSKNRPNSARCKNLARRLVGNQNEYFMPTGPIDEEEPVGPCGDGAKRLVGEPAEEPEPTSDEEQNWVRWSDDPAFKKFLDHARKHWGGAYNAEELRELENLDPADPLDQPVTRREIEQLSSRIRLWGETESPCGTDPLDGPVTRREFKEGMDRATSRAVNSAGARQEKLRREYRPVTRDQLERLIRWNEIPGDAERKSEYVFGPAETS